MLIAVRPFCRAFGTLAAILLLRAATAGESPVPVKVDEAGKKLSFTGRVAKQGHQDVLKGAVEYLICMNGGKEYESVFVCPIDAQELYDALVKIGIKPGLAAFEENERHFLPKGGRVHIFVEFNDGKETKRARAESFVFDSVHKKPMVEVDWAFTGSRVVKDPETGKDILQAVLVKNLVSMHHKDATVLLQNPLRDAIDDTRYHINAQTLPKENTPVTVTIEVAPPPAKRELPAGVRHVHLLVKGTVQGVGFRDFTQRSAKQIGIIGWVRNLPTGEVELEAEGPETKMKEFEEKVGKGPRGSKVESVEELKTVDPDELGEFEIHDTPVK